MRLCRAIPLLLIGLLPACGSDSGSETMDGIWQGVLKYPGFESRIAFIMTTQPDGALAPVMVRPDESDAEAPVTAVTLENLHVRLHVDSIGAYFEGTLHVQEGAIRGQWHHGRWSQPLVLRKVPEIVAPRRPQTPAPPYPYDEQDVTFTNPTADARLTGTLTLPRITKPCPAMILISGVGAHGRDYSILRHRPFLVLADYLTRRGLAVLRFDDRGVGQSTGDRTQATSRDYAEDVLAGVRRLRSHPRIDPDRIGLIGHSEGGTIAMLAAAESEEVAFIVLMGTPGLPGWEYNLQFEESTARTMGLPDEAVAAKRSFQERILSIIVQVDDPATAEAELHRLYMESFPSMPGERIELAVARVLSPWFRSNLAHDPGATLKHVTCPVLALFGGQDVQVPPERNLDAIQCSLARTGNPDFQVECVPGVNHFFQTAETGSPTEYGRIEETMAPTVLERIGDWVRRHAE